jgi:1-acyl-sn-glycerol-3-phosphate acyltransferase
VSWLLSIKYRANRGKPREGIGSVENYSRPWFYHFGNWALRAIFGTVLRLDFRGMDRVPREGPLIIAISHSTFLDPLLAGAYIPRNVAPMAKAEAFTMPILGWIVRAYGAYPIRRGEADLGAFKMSLKILKGGGAMVIAPEGHRSESGALQQGREGAIMLALRSGAPILPVAVWGGKPIWKNLARFKRTPMQFYVAEPLVPQLTETKPTREQMAQMSDELMMAIANEMPPDVRGYYADASKVTTHHLVPYRPNVTDPLAIPKQKEVVAR